MKRYPPNDSIHGIDAQHLSREKEEAYTGDVRTLLQMIKERGISAEKAMAVLKIPQKDIAKCMTLL